MKGLEVLIHMCKTIGQLYNERPIENAQYPLQIWYNDLLDKTENDLTVFDVVRMIRQRKFIKLAVEIAFRFLNEDPFCGDCYTGELLEKVTGLEHKLIESHREDIINVVSLCESSLQSYEWTDDFEKDDFICMLAEIKKRFDI